MYYSKTENLYYDNDEEFEWFKNIKKESIQSSSLEKLDVIDWRNNLQNYFNNSLLSKNNFLINKQFHESIKKVPIKLNIDSFLNADFVNITNSKKKILLEVDKFLKNNSLIKNKIISVQFIGSLGSKNPQNYSDFDCLMILPNNKLLNKIFYLKIKKIIFRLRLFAFAYDPNQHHDIFILTEDELINGVKPFYPLKLLKKTWGYGRDFFFTANNNFYPNTKLNLINNNQFFRRLDYEKTKITSLYNYKYILSCAFMIPVYFYNFQNKFYTKSKSIALAKIENISIINGFDLISKIRLNWPKEEKALMRNFFLKYSSKIISYDQMVKLNKMLGYYFYQNKFNHFTKSNDIAEIIKIGKMVSDYFIKKLIGIN